MKVSTKPTYQELERDHAFLFAAFKQLKEEHKELEDEFLKLEDLVQFAYEALGSYMKAKADAIPEAAEELKD